MERVEGVEPSSSAWKAVNLPLTYTRNLSSLEYLSQLNRLTQSKINLHIDETLLAQTIASYNFVTGKYFEITNSNKDNKQNK